MSKERSTIFVKLILLSKVPSFVWDIKNTCAAKLCNTKQTASKISAAALEKIKLSAFTVKENKKETRFEKGMHTLAHFASVMVILTTTMFLILPAIALETDEDPVVSNSHTHSAECYTKLTSAAELHLICSAETAVHSHTTDCCNEDGVLACEKATFVVHSHNEKCYENDVLVCSLPVIKEHTHDSSCYVSTKGELICELEETGGHSHELSCYDSEGNLICGIAESTGHTHSDACYDTVNTLFCEKEEIILHTHSDACLDEENNIICGKLEVRSHTHSDSCFDTVGDSADEEKLTCTMQETQDHTHILECYGADGTIICGMQEGSGHTHNDMCYGTWVLTCGKSEAASDNAVSESDTVSVSDAVSASDVISDSDAINTIKVLTCTKAVVESHSHTSDCYSSEGSLDCDKEESEGHSHDESCYSIRTLTCGKEEHTHSEDCFDENGTLVCALEEHFHFILCTDPEAQVFCWLNEHQHNEDCIDENGLYICWQFEHTHDHRCYEYISALIAMIDTLPSAAEANEVLLFYEDKADWDSYVAYSDQIGDLAWPIYYAYEDLPAEDQALVTNYDRLMETSWLWSMTTMESVGSRYYPMSNGEWLTQSQESYVHVNESIPKKYTDNGLVLGAKLTDGYYVSFTPVFNNALTEEEALALTGHSWVNMDSAGLDHTYGANVVLPSDATAKAAFRKNKQNFIVYYNVGSYNGKQVDLLIQIVNYDVFEDATTGVQEGILGFYSNGYIGVAVCGVSWVQLQYNFISHTEIEDAIAAAKTDGSLSGYRMTVRGSTSFYDIDYQQAVQMAGSTNTPWSEMLMGIYVSDVKSDVPDLDYVNSMATNTEKRNYFRDWTADDCILRIGTVSSPAGPVIYSSHAYDAADEHWESDSKHGFTATFEHTWFYMNFSFDKGRNAEGAIRHYGLPVDGSLFTVGSMTVEKQVIAPENDPNKTFGFQIALYTTDENDEYIIDTSINGTYGDVTFENGIGTFSLKNGGTVQLSELPIPIDGLRYRITEVQHAGYVVETTSTSQLKGGDLTTYGPYATNYYEGTLYADAATVQQPVIHFTNYGAVELPHTGGIGSEVYLISGMMLTSFALFILLRKKHRELVQH